MADVVSKMDFARLVKRDPAFVSRAISSGQIHGEALVGSGRGARIRVDVAMQQLGRALDLGQQLAQPVPILPPVAEAVAPAAPAGVVEFQEPQPHGGALKRRKAPEEALSLDGGAGQGGRGQFDDLREESLELKNRRQRLDVERLERDHLRQSGELVRAADVAAELRRQLQPLVATFDEVPAVIAKAISEQFSLPYAEVLIEVKGALRVQRDAWTARARMVGQEAGVPA